MPSMDYLVTWTLSRGQTISRSKHSDQSNDAATSASQSENDLMTSNQFTIEGIDFGLSFDSISYFSVHLIELSSFTDVTSYVGAKFVFEVLPSTSPGENNQTLILSNLKAYAKYEVFVTTTNINGESGKSNCIVFFNSKSPSNCLRRYNCLNYID